MNRMNRTFLLTLLSRCQQKILEDMATVTNGNQNDSAPSGPTPSPSPAADHPRKSYDNAYFYILFVMFFYFFLSATLFKNFIGGGAAKKDPYGEFMGAGSPSAQKFNAGPASEKFDFEEESSL